MYVCRWAVDGWMVVGGIAALRMALGMRVCTVAWVSLWTWVFGITYGVMRGIGIGIGIGIGEQEEVMSSLAG